MNWCRILFRPGGRIGRSTFWCGLAVTWLGSASFMAAGLALIASMPLFSMGIELMVVPAIALFAFLLGTTNLCVKRLHDRGRSGWWLIAPIAPILVVTAVLGGEAPERGSAISIAIGLATMIFYSWTLLEMGFRRGVSGPNRFGDDPLNPVVADAAM